MVKAYLVDVGVLLSSCDPEYEAYAKVYDKKHSFYDENQYYCKTQEQAVKDVKDYVNDGVGHTYGVVSETYLPDDVDWNDCPVEQETYELAGVVYSATKTGDGVVENFLEA